MRKFLFAMCVCIVALSTANSVFAHTHLTETSPSDGQAVTENISELQLNFDGEVGEGSVVEISSSTGEEMTVSNIIISETMMIVMLAEPLPNDDYTVKWSIISADGHPLEGSYMFKVNAPVQENDKVTNEEQVTENKQQDAVEKDNEPVANSANDSNSIIIIIAIALAVLVVVSLIALLRKKSR